jgi:hypothetical protein
MFLRWTFIFATCIQWMVPERVHAADPSLEYEVKAVCVLNSARFVTWPAGSFSSDTSPLVIGILGENPFGSALQTVVGGETVQKRRIVVRSIGLEEAASTCHILFVSRSERGRLERIVERLGTSNVLTISDIEGFARNRGMIGLLLEGGNVRFEVNPAAAAHAQLKIDSRLLRLARIVK